MAKNVVIAKQGNEYTQQILHKFTHKMRNSGIIPHMRKIRYRIRPASDFLSKKTALRRISRRNLFEKLIKEGKLPDSARGKRVKFGK